MWYTASTCIAFIILFPGEPKVRACSILDFNSKVEWQKQRQTKFKILKAIAHSGTICREDVNDIKLA
jgi:hypothetical protein